MITNVLPLFNEYVYRIAMQTIHNTVKRHANKSINGSQCIC